MTWAEVIRKLKAAGFVEVRVRTGGWRFTRRPTVSPLWSKLEAGMSLDRDFVERRDEGFTL